MRQQTLFDDRSARLARVSGWERYARELARRLVPEVDLSGALSGDTMRIRSDLLTLPRLQRRYEVVHYPTYPPVHIPRGAQKLVVTVHDLTWWRYPETSSLLGRRFYRPLLARAVTSSWIVTHSHAVAAEVVGELGVEPERVTVVSPGVTDLPPPRRPSGAPDGPFILTVATIEPRKNLARLAEAYVRSGLSGRVELVVVGRNAWGSAPIGIRHLHGVDDAGLAWLYDAAEAVAVPSLYEGFGLPVVEALNAGTPVVCSDLPVFREVAGEYARFVDPLDPDSIAEGLLAVLGDVVGSEGRSWAAEFTWGSAATKLKRLYGDALRS